MDVSAPQHWVSYISPFGWFQLWHPPGWTVEMAEGSLSISAPSDAGMLTINSFWLDQASQNVPSVAKLGNPKLLFATHRNLRRLAPLEVGDESIGHEGETSLSPKQPWWKKVLGRKRWRHFRLWCVRHDHVHLLALFMQPTPADPETATLARLILDTMEFADPVPVPPEMFVTQALDLARAKFPRHESQRSDQFQLRLGDARVNLLSYYRMYINSPDRFEQIVLPALQEAVDVQHGSKSFDPELEDVRDRIMPMLYPEEMWRTEFPNFVGTPWMGGLVVLYVVDEEHAYWFLRSELLERWQIDSDELHSIALENLDRYFEDQPMELTVAGEEDKPRLLVPSHADAYNSARLLSEKFQGTLRPLLGSQFAVAALSRDFFVALTLDCPKTMDYVKTKVAPNFRQFDHPLSDRLMLVTHDGVTNYLPR